MKETRNYEAILKEGIEEGKEAGVRATILRLGTKRFGIPSLEIEDALERIRDFEQLEALAERVLEAENWTDLMNPLED